MEETAKPLWVKTNVPSLYRHRDSGRYYARVYLGGKEIWRALRTKLKAIAVNRLQEQLKTVREQRAARVVLSKDKFTFGDALEVYRANVTRDSEIRESTKQFRFAGVKIVLKTWPDITELQVRIFVMNTRSLPCRRFVMEGSQILHLDLMDSKNLYAVIRA